MNSEQIQDLGRQLAEARKTDQTLAADFDQVITQTADAWAVQAAALAHYGDDTIGYKIGATSAEAQRLIGCDGPFFGKMFARDAHSPGVSLPTRSGYLAIECEFAFRLARAFPETGEDISAETAAEAIASCHPALEIIGRRTAGNTLPGHHGSISDFALNAGFIAGEPIDNWQSLDLATHEVVGLVDGEETNRGTGAAVLGHPLNGLAWLAKALSDRGERLQAGEIVSTGTCLGIIPITPGHTITGDFGSAGTISVTFEG